MKFKKVKISYTNLMQDKNKREKNRKTNLLEIFNEKGTVLPQCV